jgi:oxygen-independent coproporphyrinogen-3 oxidase
LVSIKILSPENLYYEIYELVKVFFEEADVQEIKSSTTALTECQSYFFNIGVNNGEINVRLINPNGKTIDKKERVKALGEEKIVIKGVIYDILANLTGKKPPWGILTGIRPGKIVHKMLDQGMYYTEIEDSLLRKYHIDIGRINLLTDIVKTQRSIIDSTPVNSISLYISIPFCPSRCSYCTFISSLYKSDILGVYLEALYKEIEAIGCILNENGIIVDTLYIGGGTPTVLDSTSLGDLIKKINIFYDLSMLREFTIESGRPDTITMEKLLTAKKNGVTRLSINPQTMNDGTLEIIGRKHSSKDIIETFKKARELGFDNINSDIIIGLPTEGLGDIKATLNGLEKLRPENITVHTLAFKRGSTLSSTKNEYKIPTENEVKGLLELAHSWAIEQGYQPYYLYRQKNMVGNFENIGYSQKLYEGIYNIQIMEERQTIIALGAGGVSKIVEENGDIIRRVPNVKDYLEYIKRVDEMINRKATSIIKAQELTKP